MLMVLLYICNIIAIMTVTEPIRNSRGNYSGLHMGSSMTSGPFLGGPRYSTAPVQKDPKRGPNLENYTRSSASRVV